MNHSGNEDVLMAAATQALGEGEEVLAAGVFSWSDLVLGQTVGMMAGSTIGGAVGDVVGGALGAGVGAHAGAEAMAATHGMTVALLGAVTAPSIHIFNFGDDVTGDEVATFARATTEVTISKFGLSRIIHLHDTATGLKLSLHASVAPFSAQSKPDKLVMHLLTVE